MLSSSSRHLTCFCILSVVNNGVVDMGVGDVFETLFLYQGCGWTSGREVPWSPGGGGEGRRKTPEKMPKSGVRASRGLGSAEL